MKQITFQELTPLEVEELRFCVESMGYYSKEQVEYIYNNLFREDDGLAYYYSFAGGKKLMPLYVD